ncbi:uncharacterized protein LOC132749572 [Ruditapes philippinarum]|uniref:uncharacterized protein LOC132749572 n=1 Tax=Ruditapes philippinarum TaxID=129788 RepID=UPI00295BDA6F|nr:uncharacterized protein LOC132749572 [Ruditapes philippinarum]XP_060595369.1 uncharacterized protein LOC132749572 [Ruditapes philippinarum]
MVDWKTDSKKFDKMTKEELDKYHHTPETELSLLVCRATDRNDYAQLKEYLQVLSEREPDRIHTRDTAGMTALHCAVACSSLPAVKLLSKYGAVVDAKDMLGFTPLFLATGRYPNTDIASFLITEGHANVGAKTNTGATALHGAALQGNHDCVKLLLKHGGEPRTEDNEGTTAFELAKNQEIRSLLHDAVIDIDSKKEISDVVCAQCKKPASEAGTLKRCGQCHVTLYCSKECQIAHWKQGDHKNKCEGFVIARPVLKNKDGPDLFMTSFYHVMGSQKKNVKIFNRRSGESAEKMEFLRNKRFIVKVQVPLSGFAMQGGDMMVYNADRTCEGFIHSTEKGYKPLAARIRKEGFKGIKAFFWAELGDKSDGTFKVFPGKTAPYQDW